VGNKEQLDLLKQRVATWNQWRREHSGRLGLSQANRRRSVLSGATFGDTLRHALLYHEGGPGLNPTSAQIESWSLTSDPDSLAVMRGIVASLHKKASAHS
jgi:hypothetical protein